MKAYKKIIVACIVTALVNLVLHIGTYFLFLKDFYAAHPAGSQEYLDLLNKLSSQNIFALLGLFADLA